MRFTGDLCGIIFILALATANAVTAGVNPKDYLIRGNLEDFFKAHVAEHDVKISGPHDYAHKFSNFRKNVETINEFNSRDDQTAALKLNAYSHLSPEEMPQPDANALNELESFKIDHTPVPDGVTTYKDVNLDAAPSSMDWSKMVPGGVLKQGACGACFAFATATVLSANYYITYGKYPNDAKSWNGFSVQEILSCDTYDRGCQGGAGDRAIEWVIRNGGLTSASNYPYVSGNGLLPACEPNHPPVQFSKPISVDWTGPLSTKTNMAEDVMKMLQLGPVYVDMIASNPFQNLGQGILQEKDCATENNSGAHAVVIVGYGSDDGQDYWLIQNSYGKTWGVNGIGKFARR
jgi:C1A family cysteine protease